MVSVLLPVVRWGTGFRQVSGFPAEFLLTNQILTPANATSFTDPEVSEDLDISSYLPIFLWLSTCETAWEAQPI